VSARRFLVFGCGSIGKRHIRNLIELGAGEVWAYDALPERRAEVAEDADVRVAASPEEAWAAGPDVVVVTTPSSLHLAIALEGAERGCHLFVEKPLSDSLTGLQPVIDAVERQGLTTLVACNMRFHPGLMTVKRLVDTGAVGRVVTARAQFGQYLPDWNPWRDYRLTYSARRDLGGGIILDAIHELDYLRWLLGEVETVSCFADKLSHLEIETEDTAALLLRFASGTIGEVHLDYVERCYTRTCHIVGDEGTIRWDYSLGETRYYSASDGEWRVYPDPPGWQPNQMYVDEMKHFLRCLDGKEGTAQDVLEASRVLRIALAAKESAVSHQVIRVKDA
jgi:predicted dehydrogenase